MSRVTEVPETLQTRGVAELKVTTRPEEAVAEIVTGESSRVLADGPLKLIVWSPMPIAKGSLTRSAALHVALPA